MEEANAILYFQGMNESVGTGILDGISNGTSKEELFC